MGKLTWDSHDLRTSLRPTKLRKNGRIERGQRPSRHIGTEEQNSGDPDAVIGQDLEPSDVPNGLAFNALVSFQSCDQSRALGVAETLVLSWKIWCEDEDEDAEEDGDQPFDYEDPAPSSDSRVTVDIHDRICKKLELISLESSSE